MTQPGCQCEIGTGERQCERHGCRKSKRLRELCNAGAQGKSPGVRYWRAWEEGRGPRQPQAIRKVTRKSPSLLRRGAGYVKAVAKHVLSGRRKRSAKEIDRIYDTICRRCLFFSAERRTCTICGCCVNKSARALRNKIAMATQHCPKKKW